MKDKLAQLKAEARRHGWADWICSEVDERAVLNGCWFDVGAGQHVVDFFTTFLQHSKGQWAGQPFQLMDWQLNDVVMPLFGWKQDDGRRRYQVGYISVAKKNGKSTLCAGIGLTMFVADDEHGAEVYTIAAEHEQAAIVFNEAVAMVQASPELSSLIKINRTIKRMMLSRTNSIYKALSSEAPTKEGLNISCLIFDELHAQGNRDLWDALRYGGAARRQPLLLSITTAGFDRHTICWEQYEYANRVLDGTYEDDGFFAYIAEAGKDDDWHSEETWKRANPSYGITVDKAQFKRDHQEAIDSPAKEMTFRRYRLNQWTSASSRWLSMDRWDECAGELVEWDDYKGRECWCGLDLATTSDLTAFVMVFPEEDGTLTFIPRFWIPEVTARERERKDGVPYTQWIREGYITATEGDETQYDAVQQDINILGEHVLIREIAMDRLFQGAQLCQGLRDDGFEAFPFGQGFMSMAGPTKEFEEAVKGRRIRHGGNPVLRWHASNVVVRQDPAGNTKPDRTKSTEKIDGIVAAIMGFARATVREKRQTTYMARGLQECLA